MHRHEMTIAGFLVFFSFKPWTTELVEIDYEGAFSYLIHPYLSYITDKPFSPTGCAEHEQIIVKTRQK
jgi:hypothetical protein